MSSRLFACALIAGSLVAQPGCRSRCDSRSGLLSGNSRSPAPCQTVGRTAGTGCFDAATGQPVPCPPEAVGAPVPGGGSFPYPPVGPLPGGSPVPRPDELHMPGPADMIRPPAVPVPAPGDASLPFPTSPGVPVKTAPNK